MSQLEYRCPYIGITVIYFASVSLSCFLGLSFLSCFVVSLRVLSFFFIEIYMRYIAREGNPVEYQQVVVTDTDNLRRCGVGKGGVVLGSGMGACWLRCGFTVFFFFLVLLRSLPPAIRNRGPSAGLIWPDPIWSATGIYFRAGPPAAAAPPRTPGARLQSHCRRTPFYMLEQFFSSHIQRKVLAPLLRSCDHCVVESLYARDRLGHHHLNP